MPHSQPVPDLPMLGKSVVQEQEEEFAYAVSEALDKMHSIPLSGMDSSSPDAVPPPASVLSDRVSLSYASTLDSPQSLSAISNREDFVPFVYGEDCDLNGALLLPLTHENMQLLEKQQANSLANGVLKNNFGGIPPPASLAPDALFEAWDEPDDTHMVKLKPRKNSGFAF